MQWSEYDCFVCQHDCERFERKKNINITHQGEIIHSGTMVYVSCDISANYPIDRAKVCFDVYSSRNYLSSSYIDLSYDPTSRKYVGA